VALGVPLMVIVLEANEAVTPEGNPLADPIPVPPVVACVMLVIEVFTQTVGEAEGAPMVFSGLTTMVPVALMLPQPPVKGMV
jgi:hypothetical protein